MSGVGTARTRRLRRRPFEPAAAVGTATRHRSGSGRGATRPARLSDADNVQAVGLRAAARVQTISAPTVTLQTLNGDLRAKRYFKEIYGAKPCVAFANLSPSLIVKIDK
jgi:hypothetical protein